MMVCPSITSTVAEEEKKKQKWDEEGYRRKGRAEALIILL
jgi:hypothetical protein